jgi:hypothetical protein
VPVVTADFIMSLLVTVTLKKPMQDPVEDLDLIQLTDPAAADEAVAEADLYICPMCPEVESDHPVSWPAAT